jgi:hypothetical protein
MFEPGIEIKVKKKNFKISLNLMTAQIKDQILDQGWGQARATDSLNLY